MSSVPPRSLPGRGQGGGPPQQGLAIVAHDDTLRSTGLSARGLDRESVELSLVKIVRVKLGSSYPLPLREGGRGWVLHRRAAPHARAPGRLAHHRAHRAPLARRAPPHRRAPAVARRVRRLDPTGWPAGWWSNMGLFADSLCPLSCKERG